MKNIFRIIKKNLKLLIRAKSSALIIILAPLLIILLVGIAFDNANTYGLNIGVYSASYSQDVESFISKLSQKEFKVIKYQQEERCVEDIKLGTVHTCVIFPPDMTFNSNQQQQITFYVDYSKINLVWMITDTLSSGVAARSEEISKDLTSILVSKLESTEKNLNEKKPVLLNIKTETSNVAVKAQEIDKNLAAININVSTFSINATQSLLTGVQTNLGSKIETAKSSIASAKSTISSSEASDEEKTEALGELNDALSDLNNAKLYLNSTTNTTNQSLARVYTLIGEIQTKLSETQDQIAAAAADSKTKLSQAQTSLTQSLNSLGSIETMMDNLIAEIASIKVTDPAAIATPITTNIKPVTTQKTYLNYLFPSLMILVVMFIAILLGTTLVMMEKHSPAVFRNFITPTRNITFIISTYLTNIFLVLVQLIIILGIAMYFFSGQILPTLPLVILILFLAASLFSFVGMAVGYLFLSEETGTLAAISFGSLCLFLSSTIIPLESMPTTIRQIAFYNPFVIAERLLRSVILFQPNIKFILNDIFLLLGYILILFLFIWGSQHLISKHYLQQFMYQRRKKARSKGHTSKPLETQVEAKKVSLSENKTKVASAQPTPSSVNPSKAKGLPKAIVLNPSPATPVNSKLTANLSEEEDLADELKRINSELSRLR